MPTVAQALGPNRIIKGQGIMFPVGDSSLPAEEDRELRRRIVREALDALASEAGQK